MTTLTGKKPASTYKDLLHLSNTNQGIEAGLKTVFDGNGGQSVLKLSTTAVGIGAIVDVETAINDKANLSHAQAISTVTGLQSAIDGKADLVHFHLIGNVTGLQDAIDGKANSSHTHAIADITGLQSAIDGKSDSSHTHPNATISVSGFLSSGDKIKLDGIEVGATADQTASEIKSLLETLFGTGRLSATAVKDIPPVTTSASDLTSGILEAARLAASGVTAGTYGSATLSPIITVDNKGRVTSASEATISGGGGSPNDLGIHDLICYFGDGSDGDATISSGTTTLVRDMYYNNLTLSGTGKISTSGFRLFVKGILSLDSASADAISFVPSVGGSTASASSGGNGANYGASTVGVGGAGVSGTAGTTTNSANGTTPTTVSYGNGGSGGTGGDGGAGSGGSSGANRAGATVTNSLPFKRFAVDLLFGNNLISGGAAGGGSTGGGGDGTNTGGGSGGSGSGGGVTAIYARTISRGGSTAAGAISAKGGNGGNGATRSTGNVGGGGGGGAGGGGWVYLAYETLEGSMATDCLNAAGGNGGTGGNGVGTGTNGQGGNGGNGGRTTLVNLATGIVTENTGATGTIFSGTTGGTGGAALFDL